jgi:uncharacterized protein (TIGR02001 family)
MKTMKVALVAAAAAAVLAPAQAEGLSFNVGVLSAYTDDSRFDRDSQFFSKKAVRPALTFGVDYDFGNGFYIGNANTSAKFAREDDSSLKDAVEMNLYAGYANELANGIRYDVSATRYVFTGLGFNNSNEATVAVGYGPVTLAYSKPFTSSKFEGEHYVDLTFSHSFTDAISADLTFTKDQGVSKLSHELVVSYDLGNNLTATASFQKDRPVAVLGLSKSF